MTDLTRPIIGIALNAHAHDLTHADLHATPYTPDYWLTVTRLAESAGVDFVSLGDAYAAEDRAGRIHLDASLLASRLAAQTDRIGIIASAIVNFTEPFHVSTAISTLDYVSAGRAGLELVVPSAHDAQRVAEHSGGDIYGLPVADRDALFRDADDAARAIRRLWDSWEDDAEIRDVATGRFVDATKLHYVDVKGEYFSVKGPSIVPRPPQGQPVVAVTATDVHGAALAARQADVVFLAARDDTHLTQLLHAVRAAAADIERPIALRVVLDIAVSFEPDAAGWSSAGWAAPLIDSPSALTSSNASLDAIQRFDDTPLALASYINRWRELGVDGFRLHPYMALQDTETIAHQVLPQVSTGADAGTLRDRLGLPVARNRYATGGSPA